MPEDNGRTASAGGPRPAARLVWAVDSLALRPQDRVLEIGCGSGVAVSLVCARLEGGRILGVDRSPAMIAQAARRNAACVAAGKAAFCAAPLHEADLGGERFDAVFAVRVGVFVRGDPARELAVVAAHLAPGGRLSLFYDPPAADGVAWVTDALGGALRRNGWEVLDVARGEGEVARVVRVVARPAGSQ